MSALGSGFMVRCLDASLMVVGLLSAKPAAHASRAERWSPGKLPVLGFETLDGNRFDTAGLMGKVVVANFWSDWSATCSEELPVLAQMAASTQRQPVEYLLVNTGDANTAIAKMRDKIPARLDLLRLSDDALGFRFSSLPVTVIFDTHMRARWVVRGSIDAQGEPLRSLIADLLAESNTRSRRAANRLYKAGN